MLILTSFSPFLYTSNKQGDEAEFRDTGRELENLQCRRPHYIDVMYSTKAWHSKE